MDLKGSLVNTNLKIYPTEKLLNYLKLLKIDDSVPINIIKLLKGNNIDEEMKKTEVLQDTKTIPIYLNSKDIENLNKIKATVKVEEEKVIDLDEICKLANTERDAKSAGDSKDVKDTSAKETTAKDKCKGDFIDTFKLDDSNKITKNTEVNEKKENTNDTKKSKEYCNESIKNESSKKEESLLLTTTDIDWLYGHLQKLRTNGEKSVPYLHELLEGVQIATPDNIVIKRNPVLEARCVKLRAQQEAREYRKMTKSVDNVRMRFPEDSISYQLKQVNRQLIAIGQFIISIFAGFLFGFKGVEWMIGQLDFGFRLLLGVMCALIIALAEIYFLAKKLNEELNVPETIQLGGPPKFVDQQNHFIPKVAKKESVKEHED